MLRFWMGLASIVLSVNFAHADFALNWQELNDIVFKSKDAAPLLNKYKNDEAQKALAQAVTDLNETKDHNYVASMALLLTLFDGGVHEKESYLNIKAVQYREALLLAFSRSTFHPIILIAINGLVTTEDHGKTSKFMDEIEKHREAHLPAYSAEFESLKKELAEKKHISTRVVYLKFYLGVYMKFRLEPKNMDLLLYCMKGYEVGLDFPLWFAMSLEQVQRDLQAIYHVDAEGKPVLDTKTTPEKHQLQLIELQGVLEKLYTTLIDGVYSFDNKHDAIREKTLILLDVVRTQILSLTAAYNPKIEPQAVQYALRELLSFTKFSEFVMGKPLNRRVFPLVSLIAKKLKETNPPQEALRLTLVESNSPQAMTRLDLTFNTNSYLTNLAHYTFESLSPAIVTKRHLNGMDAQSILEAIGELLDHLTPESWLVPIAKPLITGYYLSPIEVLVEFHTKIKPLNPEEKTLVALETVLEKAFEKLKAALAHYKTNPSSTFGIQSYDEQRNPKQGASVKAFNPIHDRLIYSLVVLIANGRYSENRPRMVALGKAALSELLSLSEETQNTLSTETATLAQRKFALDLQQKLAPSLGAVAFDLGKFAQLSQIFCEARATAEGDRLVIRQVRP